VQRQAREETARALFTGQDPYVFSQYDAAATLSSAYAHLRWEPSSRGSVAAGARVDHWTLTHDAAGSPWAQGELRLRGTLKLRGGAGIFRQFPGFPESLAFDSPSNFGEPPLENERAYHTDLGLEQALGSSARWQLTLYNRTERDVLREPCCEPRLINGSFLLFRTANLWANSLDGYARGVEMLVQRRSNTGLSGWVSYAYGVNHYTDHSENIIGLTDESFDGDFDQRHTFNAYGLYRVTNRLSLAAKVRIGSNTPAIGYWEERDGNYYVGSVRNIVRVPLYSRVDLRANRTFNWERKRLTLFVELLNALGRENVRFERPFFDQTTFQVFGMFNAMIPRVPSAGMLIEF
jgi:hypothetical protein